MGIRIVSTGVYVPERVVTNSESNHISPQINDDNLKLFVGAGERHICSVHETPTYMGIQAAKTAISNAKLDPQSIDTIICYTLIGDHEVPKDVYKIAAGIGCDGAMCWSIDTACATFLSQLNCADALVKNGKKRILLINSTNWVSRGFPDDNPLLPGDGAGAVIVEEILDGNLIDCIEKSSAAQFDFIKLESAQLTGKSEYFEFSNSPRIIHRAISILPEIANEVLAKNNIKKDEVDWTITHQPGVPAILKWHELLDIPVEKNLNTFSLYGNMSAANIPITLDHFLNKEKKIKSGDLVLMFTAGAGIHAAAALYRF